MPDPIVRIDRVALNEEELIKAKSILYWMADMTNALTSTGGIYGQILLSPEQAEAKRAAQQMEG